MGELKFRAWWPDAKKMVYFGDPYLGLDALEKWGIHFPALGAVFLGPCEIDQFTGMLDVNGREIFEGDILKDSGGASAVEWAPGRGGWGVRDEDGCMTLLADWVGGMEIIGNIHENPDLAATKQRA